MAASSQAEISAIHMAAEGSWPVVPAERRRLVAQVQDRMRFMETEGLGKLSGSGLFLFARRFRTHLPDPGRFPDM